MSYRARRAISTILGIIGAFGTVATTVLAVKETPKAMKKMDELKQQYGKKIPIKILLKEFIPIYWPALLVGTATIVSPIAATIMSRKTEASLIATSTMLSQGWNKYKYKVKEYIGPKGEKLLRANIAQDEFDEKKPKSTKGSKLLYYEEHIGWFYADPVELQAGLEDINQRLYTPDVDDNQNGPTYWATLYLFMKDSKAEVLDQDRLESCYDIGWTVEYISEMYVKRFVWVHPSFIRVFDKETGVLLYTALTFEEEPIYLNMYELEREFHNFKKTGKYDYMHEAESNINFPDDEKYEDRAALDLEFKGNQAMIDAYCGEFGDRVGPVYSHDKVYYKDYDSEDDILADQTFVSSSPTNKEHVVNAYPDGTIIGSKENHEPIKLPDINEVSELEGK